MSNLEVVSQDYVSFLDNLGYRNVDLCDQGII